MRGYFSQIQIILILKTSERVVLVYQQVSVID